MVILGKVGDNFAAGMTGGMSFIYDKSKEFETKVNPESVIWQNVETEYWTNFLKKQVLEHLEETGSLLSKSIIDNFDEEIKNFIQVSEQSEKKSIVGERVKRSENLFFKTCYQFHKFLTLSFTGQSIKFGNFTCLTKSTIEKMLNEKATWNSFSGALTKVENNLVSIPSTRGNRYFGPSKMSFYNLIKHSLSIISVFKKTFLIRSAFFIIFYILLIKSNASIITAIPLIFLFIAVYSISNLALRENMDEFEKSLENISNIDTIR